MNKLLNIFLSIFLTFSFFSPVFAEELNSGNYLIKGASLNSGGQPKQSSTGDFKLLDTIGDFSGDPRVTSANYQAKIGEVEVFTAKVPKISCFETTGNTASSCITGASYITSGGMERVCGPTGCYDRARFEIDDQGNPSDTLYAIQISTDNFASDISYIDGITKKPITVGSQTIDDYLTKTDWESSTFNIFGLESSTQYHLRAIALHGDFTESIPGPSAQATTSQASMSFDIDIANTTGTTSESSAPYAISFENTEKLIQTGPTLTAPNLIWLDAQTNGLGGLAIVLKGENGGLVSATASYTIASSTIDLDGTTEGFGIQSFYTSQAYNNGSGNGELGSISVISPYNGSTNSVGAISTVFNKIYQSSGPIHSGRVGLYLKARASSLAGEATDYTETITIVMIPRY